ncbi:MAG: DUF2314 domain-containing protein, partial [Woeseiaceae bacterium]
QKAFQIEVMPASPSVHWTLRLTHKAWGQAELSAHRNPLIPPEVLFDQSVMTEEERNLARRGTTSVTLTAPGKTGNVLIDRKTALRILSHCLGEYGVAVVDEPTLKVWTPAMLAEELAHDAPLDIDGILAAHWVSDADSAGGCWLHTHGLKEIGQVDFGVLDPSPDLNTSRLWDVVRAMALAIVEGTAKVGGHPYPLIYPGGAVALIESDRFIAKGEAAAAHRFADMADEFHRDGHVVLCDPPASGFFARLRPARFRPCRFLSNDVPDNVIINFSRSASLLMAERARGTYSALRQLSDEFAELELPVLVKLGYQVDGGGADDREYLWFEVHALGDDWIDATLTNDPYNISRLRNGDRGRHSVELLADWAIFTPAGAVNPRTMFAVRAVREHREEWLEELARQRDTPQKPSPSGRLP